MRTTEAKLEQQAISCLKTHAEQHETITLLQSGMFEQHECLALHAADMFFGASVSEHLYTCFSFNANRLPPSSNHAFWHTVQSWPCPLMLVCIVYVCTTILSLPASCCMSCEVCVLSCCMVGLITVYWAYSTAGAHHLGTNVNLLYKR